MRRRIASTGGIALACGLFLAIGLAQDEPRPDHYTAVWAMTGGGAGGTTVMVDIHVNRYNTDQEVLNYAQLLAAKGADALQQALEKEDVGQFAPVGAVGTQLAIARKLKKDDKTVIRVISVRRFSFAELRNSGRSLDYPYTMLELVLDKSGKGTGAAIGAAKITFNKKKNVYEIESFQHGAAYNKLLNVQKVK